MRLTTSLKLTVSGLDNFASLDTAGVVSTVAGTAVSLLTAFLLTATGFTAKVDAAVPAGAAVVLTIPVVNPGVGQASPEALVAFEGADYTIPAVSLDKPNLPLLGVPNGANPMEVRTCSV